MADRKNEIKAERESAALAKLQQAAGLVDRPQAERLDWMYEQSAVQQKKTDEELMNLPIETQKDKDLEDVKKLNENTAGSLFLKSATKTNEDMLRKLREDPLFQIRREEQAARASMMSNPLVMARVQQKADKAAKKEKKKAKKVAKKEKKRLKKAAKKEKKAAKKAASSSSSDSSDSSATGGAAPPVRGDAAADRRRTSERADAIDAKTLDTKALGPSVTMVSKREERERLIAERKELALASRGAAKRMNDEDRKRKLDQMKSDAATHDRYKDRRIADAERKEKEIEEKESQMRAKSDQSYFRDIRKDAYTNNDQNLADRLKSQRHRRGKNLNDNLERD